MTAKQAAIRDIKNDLRQNAKCFIAFHKELNSVMEQLVNEQLKVQKTIKH